MTTERGLPITLNMNELPVTRLKLNAMPLSRIAEAILPELCANYENATIEVIRCPDLTQWPFNLVSEGLNGNENVLDIGDPINIIPEMKREKLYDVNDLKEITGSDPLFIIGPCAGPHPFLGVDSECVENVKIAGDRVENGSHVLTSLETAATCFHSLLPDGETRFSMLANFFASNGFRREVLKIVCEIRKGPLNFPTCVGQALAKHFGDEVIAMGGVMLMENGKVKVHVVKPDLAKAPLKSTKDLVNWLHFIELIPPSVGLGTIVSYDPGLNLRLEHFHLYTADNSQGGHYHNDTEPNTIKYTGYFSVAKELIKIDQTQGQSVKFFG